jgi:hypothetical protein
MIWKVVIDMKEDKKSKTKNEVKEETPKIVIPSLGENADDMQKIWGMHPAVAKVAVESARVYSMKHGMFAGVPIICKDTKCPYAEVCTIDVSFRIVGKRCPMEAGAIMARYNAWCKHFEIDLTGKKIKDEDLVDATLIRDLVENEIQTLRAENRIAMNADFIGKTLADIDNKGSAYYEDTVTPEAEYLNTLQDKRYKILNLLNSTRKDKANEKSKQLTPSEKAVSIFKKVAEIIPNIDDIDDIEP